MHSIAHTLGRRPRLRRLPIAAGAVLALLAGTGLVADPAAAQTTELVAVQASVPQQTAATRAKVKTADPGDTVTVDTSTRDVNVVGVSWKGSAPKRLQVRYRDNGTWSGWQGLDTEGDGPDAKSAEAAHAAASATASTDPITVIGSQAVQIRSDDAGAKATGDLKVTAASTDVTAADKAVAAASSTTGTAATGTATTGTLSTDTAAQAEPAAYTAQAAGYTTQTVASTGTYNSGLKANIVTRKQWGADESKVRCKADVASKFVMSHVHHTSGSNSYSKSEAPGIIRGYLAFHTSGRGWCDLGYNFLVDRFGTIYEGRAGSITKAVVGAHASGFNTGSLGISVLGTFNSKTAPAKVKASVARIIAWKANQYGFNPAGKITRTSPGGGTTKYKKGTKVTLNRVSGHRDTSNTDCPGTKFYKDLPALRKQAVSLQAKLKSGTSTQPAIVTTGAIGTYYKKHKSALGAPVANQKKSGGGYYQKFKNGLVHWHKKTGAHWVKNGKMRNAWVKRGAKTGRLGFPTTDLYSTKKTYTVKVAYKSHGKTKYKTTKKKLKIYKQRFQGGYLYHRPGKAVKVHYY